MLIQHWNIGHMQSVWNIRQNKNIVDIFSTLWNCTNEELLVSFDGISFNLPPEVMKRGWNRNNTWYHTKPRLFPKHPRTYGNELPVINNIEKPQLSELGKKLAGF